jgi:MFS family permease
VCLATPCCQSNLLTIYLLHQIYIPALPVLSEAFNESIKTINLTLSIYLIAQGLTPMIWASTADAIGRR